MIKIQMTKTKTTARETRETREKQEIKMYETRIGRTHGFAPTEIRDNSGHSWVFFV